MSIESIGIHPLLILTPFDTALQRASGSIRHEASAQEDWKCRNHVENMGVFAGDLGISLGLRNNQ